MKITKSGKVVIEDGKPIEVTGFTFAFTADENPAMPLDELQSRMAEAAAAWAQDRLEVERKRAVKEVIKKMIANQKGGVA